MLKQPPPPSICCDSKKCLVQLWHSSSLKAPSDLSVNTLVITSLTSFFPFCSSLHSLHSILISCHPVSEQSCCLYTTLFLLLTRAKIRSCFNNLLNGWLWILVLFPGYAERIKTLWKNCILHWHTEVFCMLHYHNITNSEPARADFKIGLKHWFTYPQRWQALMLMLLYDSRFFSFFYLHDRFRPVMWTVEDSKRAAGNHIKQMWKQLLQTPQTSECQKLYEQLCNKDYSSPLFLRHSYLKHVVLNAEVGFLCNQPVTHDFSAYWKLSIWHW